MTDLFLTILNLSFSATWVVLAVVLARLLLKKAPRRLVCALWALVALRLLFGGIEAPFSLIPSTELIPPESLFDQSPAIHSGITSLDNAVNPIYSESLRPTPGASVNPLQVWLAVFANLWVLGMAAMFLWADISCWRVRRQVRESVPEGDQAAAAGQIAGLAGARVAGNHRAAAEGYGAVDAAIAAGGLIAGNAAPRIRMDALLSGDALLKMAAQPSAVLPVIVPPVISMVTLLPGV